MANKGLKPLSDPMLGGHVWSHLIFLPGSLWYEYHPTPIWPSLLTPGLSLSSPSHLWLCQSLVSWSTWGISSPSLGHLGLKADTCGSPIFTDLLGRLTWGYWQHLDFPLVESWEHLGQTATHSFFPEDRGVGWLISPGLFFIQGLCSCFHTAHKMSHPCDLTC